MADTKISDLTDGNAPRSADALVVARSGANNKILASSLDWISDEADTWTYASADAPTFTFTVSGDKTGELTVGKRLKLTQTTVKYFIVTACSHSSGTTTVTIYGGTDYTLANAAISANHHSGLKAPAGFPLNPTKWTVEVLNTNTCAKSSPTNGTWYGDTGLSSTGPSISIPIGCWYVEYSCSATSFNSGADTYVNEFVSLSTSASSESDTDFTAYAGTGDASAAGKQVDDAVYRRKTLLLAAKTTYYLIIKTDSTATLIQFSGAQGKSIIRAVCAYL